MNSYEFTVIAIETGEPAVIPISASLRWKENTSKVRSLYVILSG